MGKIKNIFKIILLIQLLTCTLAAYYGHPDAETIDFGSPTQPNRDQLITEAAIKRGMDGDAVAELLRTRKPVVKTTTTPEGFTKTTTYKLEPDGSISSKSILQKRHRYVYNTHEIPEDLRNSPSGTVTRTYTDSDGSKVTQTIAVSKPKASSVLDPDDLTDDWFNKPFPSWPEESAPTGTVHRTITRTFTGPNGERRTVQSSSWPESPVHHVQPSYNNRPITRTYDKPEKDPFDFDDEDGWEIVSDPDVETTTRQQFNSWTPKTWEWPEFPTHPTTASTPTKTSTTTTTTKTKLYIEPEPTTLKPIPSLEEFLKSQYGKPSEKSPATTTSSTHRTHTTTSKTTTSTTTPQTSTTTKVINIDDLPVVEVLHDGKPANDSILKLLPPHLTPQAKMDPVIKVENKHPIDEDVEVYTPKVETNIRTFSKTHIGPEKPKLKDLDPQMQEILRKAGISPEDITDINGDTITKTRKEPDGRVITTTLKINTLPSEPKEHKEEPQQNHYIPSVTSQSHYGPSITNFPQFPSNFNSYNSFVSPHSYTPSLHPVPLTPISEFLARLGLTRHDLTSRNNRYTKTFVDENGDVLTATFVLTTGRGSSRPKPYK